MSDTLIDDDFIVDEMKRTETHSRKKDHPSEVFNYKLENSEGMKFSLTSPHPIPNMDDGTRLRLKVSTETLQQTFG